MPAGPPARRPADASQRLPRATLRLERTEEHREKVVSPQLGFLLLEDRQPARPRQQVDHVLARPVARGDHAKASEW